ncbi:MAG: hypothetical protein LBP23_08075 [Treponema sp.]|jgi:hypothetical protein|nr:hypothetical protein [Treponema sp.]
MKTYKAAVCIALVFAPILFFACTNPYMVHNLERPVYLTGIEVRSDVLTADEPSHPLDQMFQEKQTSYTVTIPFNAKEIYLNGIPEGGAWVAGDTVRQFDTGQDETTFTLIVNKEHRQSVTYTVRVLRGLPVAELLGLELYISDEIDGSVNPLNPEPVNADDFEKYERDNCIINFVSKQDTYEVAVPFHTSHLIILARSYVNQENRVERISYEFKDFEGNTIGAGGVTPGSFVWSKNCNSYTLSPVMPSWYTPGNNHPPLEWGDLQVYPGLGADGPDADSDPDPIWFGKGTFDPLDPDPRGRGKVASITVTVSSSTLSDMTYTIKLQRESGAAYLDRLEITSISGAGPAALPETGGAGTPDPSGTNRLVGNFAKTLLNYDAAIPNSANAFTITPVPDWHIVPALPDQVTYTYTTYYYEVDGTRWYIDSGGVHHRSTTLAAPEDDTEPYKLADRTGPVSLYYDTDTGDFMKYVRMEVYVRVTSPVTNPRTYRATVRRQKDAAVLEGIRVEPYAPPPTDGYPDGNVFTQAVAGNPDFNPQVVSYTVEVNAGRTKAKLILDNDGGPLPGSVNRIIRVIGPEGLIKEFRGGPGAWKDETNAAVPVLAAEVELKNRSTQVRVQIEDNPAYAPREYVINLLSKNQNDIILPVDADNDGVVRAVFAGGSNDGLTAERALPGEKIRLTVSANLGYYIDWGNYGGSGDHPSPLPEDKYHGVAVYASTLVMGDGNDKVHYTGSPAGAHLWKSRIYEFNMPDENVTFTVKYRPTVAAVEKIAYVAEGAPRGGGYGTGSDGKTATSWGKASNDLQAVINSWTGPGQFSEIWVLRGAYTPPDPDTYIPEPTSASSNCFPAGSPPHSAGSYRVKDYTFTGIAGKEDISFVLRPGIKIYGGFEETDDRRDGRSAGAAGKTVLNGEFADGTRAHHVVLAVDAPGTVLDTLTITGGIGPEAASSITVKQSSGPAQTVSRQAGGGLCNINSSVSLSNVIIRNNKSTNGGGMYTRSVGNIAPRLYNVEFYSNTALESGGGMYNTGPAGRCEPWISNSTFRENKSVNRGGGLYNDGEYCEPLIDEGSHFVSNSAKEGGGIYNNGGESEFHDITVEENWTSGSGSGIYNGSESWFFNIDVRKNESKGGSGIGIFNTGILHMTNAAITENKLVSGGPQGGGLYNGGTAILSNTTISGNTALNGGGIHNRGNLIMANVIINGNDASSGGGLTNQAVEAGSAAAMLTNVTLAGNTGGGGIYNDYEGSAEASGSKEGTINLVLTNVRITGNNGNGIYNNYWRFGGRGINLTLNNTTIAANVGYGIRSHKDTSRAHFSFTQDEEDSLIAVNRKSFPVRVRFRNTVVWGNSLAASYWSVGSSPVTPNPRESRETYEYSLLEDMNPGGTNLDGTTAHPGLFASSPAAGTSTGGDYRPESGSVLVDAGNAIDVDPKDNARLYPVSYANLVSQLFWKIGGDGGIAGYNTLPFYQSGSLVPRNMSHFLGYDNSYNKGDLRPGMNEGDTTRPRPGVLDIGAYEW